MRPQDVGALDAAGHRGPAARAAQQARCLRITSSVVAAIAPCGLLPTFRLHTCTAVANESSQTAVRNAPTPPAPNVGIPTRHTTRSFLTDLGAIASLKLHFARAYRQERATRSPIKHTHTHNHEAPFCNPWNRSAISSLNGYVWGRTCS